MNINKLPKQEDVIYEDSDGNKVLHVTDENQDAIAEFAVRGFVAPYIGTTCPVCSKIITAHNFDEFEIYGGDGLYHEDCWNNRD